MIEEEQGKLSEHGDAKTVTAGEMAVALDAVKSAAPSLAGALDSASVTPAGLAESHERAKSEDPDLPTRNADAKTAHR